MGSARNSLRTLAIIGLAVFSVVTALGVSVTASVVYHRWLWNAQPSGPGGHGELTPTRAMAIEFLWQSTALVALWLGLWWLLFVRQAGMPLWANHKALKVLAAFAIFTGAITAGVMANYVP